MPILAVAATTLLSLPQFVYGDAPYPEAALREQKTAAVSARVVLRPDGSVASCNTIAIVGDVPLGKSLCQTLSNRKHTPAKSLDGTPAWSVVLLRQKFSIPGLRHPDWMQLLPKTIQWDMDVARLPGGSKSAIVKVVVAVDPAGTITGCKVDDYEKQVQLAKAVCANSSTIKQAPLLGSTGAPVPYVTGLMVQLNTEPSLSQ